MFSDAQIGKKQVSWQIPFYSLSLHYFIFCTSKTPSYQQYACVDMATPAVVGNIFSLKCGHNTE